MVALPYEDRLVHFRDRNDISQISLQNLRILHDESSVVSSVPYVQVAFCSLFGREGFSRPYHLIEILGTQVHGGRLLGTSSARKLHLRLCLLGGEIAARTRDNDAILCLLLIVKV